MKKHLLASYIADQNPHPRGSRPTSIVEAFWIGIVILSVAAIVLVVGGG